jgi:isovaleryl-CoA dehydrogenase
MATDGYPSEDQAVSPFDLSPMQREVMDEADRFAREKLAPYAEKMDNEEWWPDEMFPLLGESGYLCPTVSEEYGGAGLDLFTSNLIGQAFSRWNPAVAFSAGAHDNLCANNIFRNANEHLKQKYLPALVKGEKVGCLGMTEPGAGSDAVGGMQMTARRVGDEYVLNGRKIYITNGPIADVILVYAKTAPERGAHGISAFIVEKDFPGFRVAQKMIKMGFRGSPTGELVFDDCVVPAENIVGEENTGIAVMMSGLDLERAVVCGLELGIAERALQLSVEYAGMREQFGRKIGDFQMVQGKLADMYTLTEAMRTFTYRVLAAGNNLGIGCGGRGEYHKLTASAVLFAAESLNKILNDAMQIHGGYGYMWETEINRLYRTIKLLEIGAGTSEVRRIIIAEELLK